MQAFTDQTGRSFFLPQPPIRIVSLVPSQTELLASLGLDDEVVGATKFCIHPEHWFRSKPRIGGTKTVNVTRVFDLIPDLVLANKEENVKEQVEAIAEKIPVYVSDVNILEDAFSMIADMGRITGKCAPAATLVQHIQEQFASFSNTQERWKAAYLIWKEPWMTVGGDTFIHNMLQHAGFENVFGQKHRYPVVSLEEIKALNPDVLLLSSEPYPFGQKHVAQLQPLFPGTRIQLADGEMFSWYGSRLLHAAEYFIRLRQQLHLD